MSGHPRQLNDWLSIHLDYTQAQESPEIFHLWSGMSVIAAALGRRCWVDRGYNYTYPNIYIMLVSPSAQCKKSTACEIALDIYNQLYVDLPTYSKKTTMQKLMMNMADRYKLTQSSTLYIYADEMSVLMGRSNNNEIIDFMTEVYGCNKQWDNETKTAGVDKLYNVCLNFIGCTTPRDLASLQKTIIDGGFAGRCLFIYSDTPRSPIHNPKKAMRADTTKLKTALLQDLAAISILSGEFTLSDEADEVHKLIYDANYNKKHSDFRIHPYQGRKGEHLIKLSMIVSASRGNDMIINRQDMEIAGAFLEQIEARMADSFLHIVHGVTTQHNDAILKIIRDAGGMILHSELLKKMYRYMNTNELSVAISTLEEGKMLETIIEGRRKEYHIRIGA